MTRPLRVLFFALAAAWIAGQVGWISPIPWLVWPLLVVFGALVVQRVRHHRELTAKGVPRQRFT